MNTTLLVKNLNESQMKDSGMAYILISLIIYYFTANSFWFGLAFLMLLINMIYPRLYYIPAVLWLSFSNLLGLIMSKVLLTIIFVLVITPIGIIRQILSKLSPNSDAFDSMKFKEWKKSKESVFKTVNKIYTKMDLINPY
jgi:hypothetical protein